MVEKVEFCKTCGKLISSWFLYCPFCGNECKKAMDHEDLFDNSFNYLKNKQINEYLLRLEQLNEILENIEKDIDSIITLKVKDN